MWDGESLSGRACAQRIDNVSTTEVRRLDPAGYRHYVLVRGRPRAAGATSSTYAGADAGPTPSGGTRASPGRPAFNVAPLLHHRPSDRPPDQQLAAARPAEHAPALLGFSASLPAQHAHLAPAFDQSTTLAQHVAPRSCPRRPAGGCCRVPRPRARPGDENRESQRYSFFRPPATNRRLPGVQTPAPGFPPPATTDRFENSRPPRAARPQPSAAA